MKCLLIININDHFRYCLLIAVVIDRSMLLQHYPKLDHQHVVTQLLQSCIYSKRCSLIQYATARFEMLKSNLACLPTKGCHQLCKDYDQYSVCVCVCRSGRSSFQLTVQTCASFTLLLNIPTGATKKWDAATDSNLDLSLVCNNVHANHVSAISNSTAVMKHARTLIIRWCRAGLQERDAVSGCLCSLLNKRWPRKNRVPPTCTPAAPPAHLHPLTSIITAGKVKVVSWRNKCVYKCLTSGFN